MSSSSQIGPVSQQYAAAATVPLIKSPSLWLPKPVELPNDIHPLPEDITAYFVYPFNLETHVLSQQPAPHDAISQRRARNAELLHRREVEEEQKERDALHRIAPGYNPTSFLVPMSASPNPNTNTGNSTSASGSLFDTLTFQPTPAPAAASTAPSTSLDPMDDLVNQLEAMENRGK